MSGIVIGTIRGSFVDFGKPVLQVEHMHYKNGREAKNGDKVMLLATYGPPVVGILYDAVAGNDFCNGKIASMLPNDPCPNLKECLHLDDALAAIAIGVPIAPEQS